MKRGPPPALPQAIALLALSLIVGSRLSAMVFHQQAAQALQGNAVANPLVQAATGLLQAQVRPH